ncbi:ABC-type Fe3+-hydroxamate transport system substrate-binding protein [Williamsia limnetica]|uniref:ABC-type Fe3+-hydroxamate transport system substrate-binding protein n=1 Tax=Williamsia limnetica TaxID=882452 RepID=A0A318RNX7_WILLI|nr:ABC-type Fe3+-hydroxamate transport system substrate-binding protein [Williamsia limnetica]
MTTPFPSRRLATLVAAILSTLLLLTACSGSDGSSDTDANDSASGAGYPVRVDSTYGEITVDKKPERIVVIGADYVDMLAALGEKPIAYAGSGEADEEALFKLYPWLADVQTGPFDASLITTEYKANAEAIARLNPDLIIGTPYYIEQPQYDQLSAIAPTFVTIFSPDRQWTDNLTDFGTLTGKSAEAAQVIADVDAEFVEARKLLTGLQDKTVSIADFYGGGLRLMPTYRWVEDLGLKPAANQPPAGSPLEPLSPENLDQFEGQVSLIATYDEETRAALEADPRFADLPSVQNEAQFFVGRPIIDAGLAAGPASLSWLLNQIMPLLESTPLNSAGQ